MIEETKKKLCVIIPACDCMKSNERCFSVLEKTLKDISASYAAMVLDIEVLISGMDNVDKKPSMKESSHDFFIKIHKFNEFPEIVVSFLFIENCKDDIQAVDHAVSTFNRRWKVDKPDFAILESYDSSIDRKTWAYSAYREDSLQKLDDFIESCKMTHWSLRHPSKPDLPIPARSNVQLISFITEKIDVDDRVITFSSNEDARSNVLIDKKDEQWCRHLLKTRPDCLVSGLKTWAWIDESILKSLNERYFLELLNMLEANDSVVLDTGKNYSSKFYSSRGDYLSKAFSYSRFSDEIEIKKSFLRVNAIDYWLFIKHFCKEERI